MMLLGCLVGANFAYAETVRDLVLRGNEYYTRGEYERAIEQYRSAIAEDPSSFEAVYNTGVTLMRLGRYADAERILRTIDASPRSGRLASSARRALGMAASARAAERFEALRREQSEAELSAQTIEALEEIAGIYEDAAAWFRGALDLDQRDENAARGLELARKELFTLRQLIDQLRDMQCVQESQGAQEQEEQPESETGDHRQQQVDEDHSDADSDGHGEHEGSEQSDPEPRDGTEEASQAQMHSDGRQNGSPQAEQSSGAEPFSTEPTDEAADAAAEMSEAGLQPGDEAIDARESRVQRLQEFLDREERMREYARWLMQQLEQSRRPIEKDW